MRVLLGEVTGVDTAAREVLLAEQRIPYDYLVLATGAAHSYFGRDDWAPFAPGLKRVEDATEVRRRLLTAFEQAEATDDPVERQSLLTFLIVGGGPTGVELAGAIAELARWGMEKEFRRFDPAQAKSHPGAVGAARAADVRRGRCRRPPRRSLARLGVDVRVGQPRRGHRRRRRDGERPAHSGAHRAVGRRRRGLAGGEVAGVPLPTTRVA